MNDLFCSLSPFGIPMWYWFGYIITIGLMSPNKDGENDERNEKRTFRLWIALGPAIFWPLGSVFYICNWILNVLKFIYHISQELYSDYFKDGMK